MKIRFASTAFFCAAALPAILSHAADETIYNLNGSDDKTISKGDTLTVVQIVSETYSGALSGDGSLAKQGDANLTLDGTLGISSISNTEGTLTFGSNLTFAQSGQWTVSNEATLVLQSGNDQLVVSDSDSSKTGTVVSMGSGVAAESLAGNLLRINAGSLTVSMTTAFNTIEIGKNASLTVGTGATSSLATLSGNVSLADGATLTFNRTASSSADSITYADAISGTGNVVFNGTAPIYFTKGTNQTYTGTTTLNAGSMIFSRATTTGSDGVEYWNPDAVAATLASSEIAVNAGAMFGGHVTASGNVTVGGTEFSSASDWVSKVGKNTFGAWYNGAGTLYAPAGTTLTINGDLSIASTEISLYYVTNSSGTITGYDYFGNSGGAVRVELSDSVGSGKIVANGNVKLGGTLVLVGASSLTTGTAHVFFESDPTKTTGAFDSVVYGSDNVVLLLPGVGGIGEGQYGIAAVENRNARKRAAFKEHDGAEEFVDYLVSQSNGMNKIAQAVAFAGADSVTDVVNNFSALSFSAFAEMAARQSDSEWDMIVREILRARQTPPTSEDGVRVPANFSFFSGFTADFVEHEESRNSPIYDFNTVGVYAGGRTWIDDERIAGAAVGFHRGEVSIHGNGGSFDDFATRAKIFAVFSPKFSDWALTVGGSVGFHHYDIDRETALGTNSGSMPGVDAGLFVSFDTRTKLDERIFFTPYLRFEYIFSYVGSVEESGTESRLKVERITSNNYRFRFGSGLEYTATEGRTFGIDFGFVANLGEKPSIRSEFADYENSRTTIDGTVPERMSFELAPHVGLDLGKGWTLDVVYRLQLPFDGEASHGFSIGFGKKF